VSLDVVLFDLDGTLTDSSPGIVGCMRYALQGLERPCPPDEALVSFIGRVTLRTTFGTLLESQDQELVESAVRRYRERFADVGFRENRVYAGIPEMLERVRREGRAAFVVTMKLTDDARRIVDHFALAQHFSGVYGAERGGRFEDKAELLAHLLATKKIPPEAAVMVGDRAADIIAARATRVRSVGVLWGYGSERELVEAGADILCATPGDLAECL
jgi:phosphoglycolate phosphatase